MPKLYFTLIKIILFMKKIVTFSILTYLLITINSGAVDQNTNENNLGNESSAYTSSEPTNDPQWGLLSAINLSTGKIQWQYKTEQPLIGGTLTTKAGLVFVGEGNGNFNAFDASTGNLLWQTKGDAGVNAPPISYMINGEQYIAVVAGGNKIMGFPQGDFINVYKLPKIK